MGRRKRTNEDANPRNDQPKRARAKRTRPADQATTRKTPEPQKPAKPKRATRQSQSTKPTPTPKPAPTADAPPTTAPPNKAATPAAPPAAEPEPTATPNIDATTDANVATHPAIALLDRPLGANEWIPIPLEDLLRQMQSEQKPATTTRASAAWMTIPLAAALAGLAAGWQWFGFRMLAGATFDPLPGTATMLAIIALLAAAGGPWLPLKALPRMGRWLERRRTGGPHGNGRPYPRGSTQNVGTSDSPPAAPAADDHVGRQEQPSWLHRVVRERDEPLLWTSVATLAAAAGAVAVLMVGLATPFTNLYQYLLEHFFWTPATLSTLEWTGALVATGPMWLLNGLVAGAIILAAARRWPFPQAGAAVVIGGMIGWAVADASHHQWTDLGLSCEQQVLLGIVPMFLLAGLGVLMSHDAARVPAEHEDGESDAPEAADGNERLIWLAMLVWAVGSGLAVCGWTTGRNLERLWSGPASTSDGSAYPLLLAGGAIIGWLGVRRRMPGGAGCGMAVWAAGLGAGLAATLAAQWPGTAGALRSAVLAAPAGYALAYALTAWLTRAGRRGLALAGMALAILGGLAIGLAAAQWLALPLLGPVGSMAAGALVLLAFGGLVQIFARAPSGATRHLRLGLIFASLAGALAVFPSDVRQWNHARPARLAPDTPVDAGWLMSQTPGAARRYCAIGAWRPDRLDNPELLTLTYTLPPKTEHAVSTGSPRFFPNACRALRADHAYYDLIYQYGSLPTTGPRYLGYSAEWLRNLARRRAHGGRVVLDVVSAGLNPAAEAVIARTFERAMNQPCVWVRTQREGQPVLRLATSPGPRDLKDWQPIQTLLENAGPHPVSIHSLRRDAISRALRTEP